MKTHKLREIIKNIVCSELSPKDMKKAREELAKEYSVQSNMNLKLAKEFVKEEFDKLVEEKIKGEHDESND